jgi:hypothetical protein
VPYLKLDDTTEVRLGAEWTAINAARPWSLRFGVWREPAHQLHFVGEPTPYTGTPLTVDQNRRNTKAALFIEGDDAWHGSLGYGVVFDKFQIDAAIDRPARRHAVVVDGVLLQIARCSRRVTAAAPSGAVCVSRFGYCFKPSPRRRPGPRLRICRSNRTCLARSAAWIPACAGMTDRGGIRSQASRLTPAPRIYFVAAINAAHRSAREQCLGRARCAPAGARRGCPAARGAHRGVAGEFGARGPRGGTHQQQQRTRTRVGHVGVVDSRGGGVVAGDEGAHDQAQRQRRWRRSRAGAGVGTVGVSTGRVVGFGRLGRDHRRFFSVTTGGLGGSASARRRRRHGFGGSAATLAPPQALRSCCSSAPTSDLGGATAPGRAVVQVLHRADRTRPGGTPRARRSGAGAYSSKRVPCMRLRTLAPGSSPAPTSSAARPRPVALLDRLPAEAVVAFQSACAVVARQRQADSAASRVARDRAVARQWLYPARLEEALRRAASGTSPTAAASSSPRPARSARAARARPGGARVTR